MSSNSYEMTPEQIAPHQVPVASVEFVKEWQGITGDWFRAYRAPDGEVVEIRTQCGAYADHLNIQPLTDDQARESAIEQFNYMRRGRAERMANGLPVTAKLKATGE